MSLQLLGPPAIENQQQDMQSKQAHILTGVDIHPGQLQHVHQVIPKTANQKHIILIDQWVRGALGNRLP